MFTYFNFELSYLLICGFASLLTHCLLDVLACCFVYLSISFRRFVGFFDLLIFVDLCVVFTVGKTVKRILVGAFRCPMHTRKSDMFTTGKAIK